MDCCCCCEYCYFQKQYCLLKKQMQFEWIRIPIVTIAIIVQLNQARKLMLHLRRTISLLIAVAITVVLLAKEVSRIAITTTAAAVVITNSKHSQCY